MSRTVDEYGVIKHSLQPHGLKSRVIAALVFFVVAFGGALLAAMPAQADPPPGSCYVAVPVTPTPTPPASPSTTPSPTACPPTPSPVTSTVNVPGPTVTVVKTVYITKIQTVTAEGKTIYVTQTQDPVSQSETPEPSETPPTVDTTELSAGGGSLVGWGLGTVGVVGVVLAAVGGVGILRRRRYQGAHQADNTETTTIPVVKKGDDGYSIRDYDPNEEEYGDDDLGGVPGESYRELQETEVMPVVEPTTDDITETKQIPPVV